MLKERISMVIRQLMKDLGKTQTDMADTLGITPRTLKRYLDGTTLGEVGVLIKIADLAELSLDELLRPIKEIPPQRPTPNIEIKNSPGAITAGRDNYVHVRVKRVTPYSPGPDDITGDQANKLKDMVNKVVDLEQKVKKKPKGYGAVWNALNRKMGVTFYREIKKWKYDAAEMYLMQWQGRLKKSLKSADGDDWRKERYKAIFAASRNQLGWTKDDLDFFIFERYNKSSIRDLTKKELEQLYTKIMSLKRS